MTDIALTFAEPEDAIPALLARLRTGAIQRDRLEAAAACGHATAHALCPAVVRATGDALPGLDLLDWREQQLFAADCAEAVLPIYERDYPGDDRIREAISARRNWARGKRGAKKKWYAARDAARAAASAAAWTAAGDAAWAAAWNAARDAAWDAQRARLAAYLLGEAR